MSNKYIVIVPPPTPNGDLHVGHVAGPFLAADVFARAHRARGEDVLFATGTDDSQSYVVTAAHRKQTTPEALCRQSTAEIQASIARLQLSVDGFAPFDQSYRTACIDFLSSLHRAGKFTWKQKDFFVRPSGEALFEAYVKGRCPTCLAATSGGLCEGCGHPDDYADILSPCNALASEEPLTKRSYRILVLELEQYREQLQTYYTTKAAMLRPHIRALMDEMFDRPLPDFPITYPGSWGIPADFCGADGQVINAWAEGMPAAMVCSAVAARNNGVPCTAYDSLWMAERGYRLVYFMGFDNSYFWGMSHLALLMASDGKYILPDAMITNEFYELENEKFSTSKGHVIWASDLARDYSLDAIRYHLCWTNPEHHRTNFSQAEMAHTIDQRVIPGWTVLTTNMRALLSLVPDPVHHLPISREGTERASTMTTRIARCFDLRTFSLRDAANDICAHIERLGDVTCGLLDAQAPPQITAIGDAWHEVLSLLRAGAPVMTAWDVAAAILPGRDGYDVQQLRRFELPPLELRRAASPADTAAASEPDVAA